jgi:hypothetical protein
MAGIPGDIGKGKRGGYGAARSPPGSCGYLLLSRRARALVGEMPGNIEGFVFLVCESLTALGRAGCSSFAVHYEWAKKKSSICGGWRGRSKEVASAVAVAQTPDVVGREVLLNIEFATSGAVAMYSQNTVSHIHAVLLVLYTFSPSALCVAVFL